MQAHWLFVCLMAVLHLSTGAAALPLPYETSLVPERSNDLHKIDVIGKDQRIKLPKDLQNVGKGVGIVFQPGGGWACTAFCLKPTVIATNAHCIFGRPGQRHPVELDKTRFARSSGKGGSQYKTSRLKVRDPKQPGLSIYSGYYRSRRGRLEFGNDWALAKLQVPICKGSELDLAELSPGQIAKEARGDRLSLIGYHGDKQMDGIWLSRRCRIRSTRDRRYLLPSQRRDLRTSNTLVLHTCDATRGASGSPLFVRRPEGLKVVAMNAGTIGFTKFRRTSTGRKGRVVVSRATNVAVLSTAFAEGLERFSKETLLGPGQGFERVQQLLRSAGLYDGPIDGLYGPGSRKAIVRYEQQHQMTALGLPTEKLLRHLEIYVGPQYASRTQVAVNSGTSVQVPIPQRATRRQQPLVQQIQERLYEMGCYRGPIDGLWGPQSREALRTALGSPQGIEVSSSVLAKLNVEKKLACR